MGKSKSEIFISLALIIFGLVVCIFRHVWAQGAVNWNILIGESFNQRGFEIAFLIGGIIFVVIGVLSLLGIIGFS